MYVLCSRLALTSGASTSASDGEDSKYRYQMDHKNRGYFIIINNKKFLPETGMNERSGTDQDAANLYQDFKKLGFTVELYHNQKASEMLRLMRRGACISFFLYCSCSTWLQHHLTI
jgi:Caspase domain